MNEMLHRLETMVETLLLSIYRQGFFGAKWISQPYFQSGCMVCPIATHSTKPRRCEPVCMGIPLLRNPRWFRLARHQSRSSPEPTFWGTPLGVCKPQTLNPKPYTRRFPLERENKQNARGQRRLGIFLQELARRTLRRS